MELEITLYEHVFKKTSRNEGLMTYVKRGLEKEVFKENILSFYPSTKK